jgi:hypothetical protein
MKPSERIEQLVAEEWEAIRQEHHPHMLEEQATEARAAAWHRAVVRYLDEQQGDEP